MAKPIGLGLPKGGRSRKHEGLLNTQFGGNEGTW